MGVNIIDREYSNSDFKQFNQRIHEQVDVLKNLVNRTSFGSDPLKIGAELELYLVDKDFHAQSVNLALLNRLGDPQFQTELNRFNLELNLSAYETKTNPFTQLANEIDSKLNKLRLHAQEISIVPIVIGTLPTLLEKDLTFEQITSLDRYRVLSRQLKQLRGEDFHIKIDGKESIDLKTSDVSAEGANTSFQVHLMTHKQKFVNTYNAAQPNSPYLCQLLWQPTQDYFLVNVCGMRQGLHFLSNPLIAESQIHRAGGNRPE